MKIICLPMQCVLLHVRIFSNGHAVLTQTKWNSHKFNYNIRFTLIVTVFACELMCVFKVKKIPIKSIMKYCGQVRKGKQFTWNTYHTYTFSLTICSRNTGTFFIFFVCARFISFQNTFPGISLNLTLTVCYKLYIFFFLIFICNRFSVPPRNVYVSQFLSKCWSTIHIPFFFFLNKDKHILYSFRIWSFISLNNTYISFVYSSFISFYFSVRVAVIFLSLHHSEISSDTIFWRHN